MTPARRQKLSLILVLGAIVACAVGFILYALRQNISLFYTPTQLSQNLVPKHRMIRMGGMVVKGSIHHAPDDLAVWFKLTDYQHTMSVAYRGVLPDLFREGQGVVVQGELRDQHHFIATLVLAKHDEKYMPPELRSMNKVRT